MPSPVFFDPDRKRWKRIRRTVDVFGIALSLLVVFFVTTVVRKTNVPLVLLSDQKKNYRALKEKETKHPKRRGTHRRTTLTPTQVALNSGESLRGGFYVTWDKASYASFRENIHQLDFVFPEWLHVLSDDGRLQAVTELNQLYDVVKNGKPTDIDPKVMAFIHQEKAQTEVLPLVNNFDPTANQWNANIAGFLQNQANRQRFRNDIAIFLASNSYRGLTLDIEGFPPELQPGYRTLVSELSGDLHAKGMKLYVSVPVGDPEFDYKFMSEHVDGLILMNYDQHYPGGEAGAIASQDWFTNNLEVAIQSIPRDKIICAIANYGYDWTVLPPKKSFPGNAHNVSVQEAWIEARDSESEIEFDSDSLNPHFSYLDDKNKRHDVWYLDAVAALNQMRAARALGISTFALWRLGSEDRSIWQIWDEPNDSSAPGKLKDVPPGQDVDMEGEGEILKIEARPVHGTREITFDSSTGLITDETFSRLPSPYRIGMYGNSDKRIAITFDDGPDPQWTPKVLDELKKENAKATFFLIGLQAQKYAGLTKRIFREGHEIGNHTFTHPDISGISKEYMRVELNLTERLFAGRLGVKPVLFRPPYSIDQEPDTADEVRPLEIAQEMGFITVGDKIDPNDWRDDPRPTAEQITNSVVEQLGKGNVILLHDGGGNRAATVRAIPMIIHELRARGYSIVPISELLDKKYEDVMPAISPNERFWAQIDAAGFLVFGLVNSFIVLVFFIGDLLMTGRLIFIGTFAVFDRFLRRRSSAKKTEEYTPRVAVLVPAYNEEAVVERTVRAVLNSDYPNLRVIVIDDGSTDRTYEVARRTFAKEIDSGVVTVLTHKNGGKASALNYALQFVDEEIFVGIDADTIIAPDAIRYLVPHFHNPHIGAIAGNAKVGNRINLWTQWQALEYITSQNFERRALNTFSAVSVVPGAIGAWRTAAVRDAGGYHIDTVAEDADLTMALLEAGYKVEYEDRALAYTEAPTTASSLMRQRFRWSFGILQAVFKHRLAFLRGGGLGWLALPNIVVFQILLPLVSPFIDMMFVVAALKYLVWDKHFHPDTADPAGFQQLVLFFALFLVIDLIASTIAFMLERPQARQSKDWLLLGHVWLQRFAYRQLFSVVLIKTLKRALEGGHFSWDKLDRTATVQEPLVKKT